MSERTQGPWWRWAIVPALLLTVAGGVASVMGRLDVSSLLFPGADKALHFALYGGVAFGAMGWLARWRGRWVLAMMSAIAIADELAQRFEPHRTVDALDAVCSLAGIVVLGVLARILRGQAVGPTPACRAAPRA